MDIKTFLRNPIVAWSSAKKRRDLKLELLEKMRTIPGMEKGMQFEGVTLNNPTPEHATILLVLRDIVNEDRRYSIVQWPGGISLVRTAQVDAIAQQKGSEMEFNEQQNFVIRGGSDKAADLLSPESVATAKGTVGHED
jgi:hypothetical protein